VELVNDNPYSDGRRIVGRMNFEPEDRPTLLFQLGTFGGNLLRSSTIIYCRLLFLLAAGLCLSTVLGFPVASLVCLSLFLVATLSGFLSSAVALIPSTPDTSDFFEVLTWAMKLPAKAIIWLVPSFPDFNPVPTLVGGRAVTLIWVLDSIAKLVLIRVTLLGLLAFVLLQRRELADASTT
jgi:hypothetical protein